MAQSKSFFGLRKGSTKTLTFQVLNGKQITKDRVYNVKNPQSLAQMKQRALMATAVTAYSQLKAICDHSFEGVEVGAKSMSVFIRENVKLLASGVPNVNVTEYKSSVFASNPYIVSKGSLNAPKTDLEDNNFKVHTNVPNTGNQTWGIVAETMGIKKDGMLTFVVANNGICLWLRIKFNEKLWNSKIAPSTDDVVDSLLSLGAVEGNALEFKDMLSIKAEGTEELILQLELFEGDSVAAIISEKSEGKWKRSTAKMEGNFEYNFESGFATYPVNTSLLLNGGKMSSNVL